ncbi:protein kinase domain-containing protein [Nonomuraea jiangxiensis]|uniref:non-specific serine/threonine protein kinase n=1 Tax=Nonomuraea jiangxiensis TaxID=633440 RepID=A0A1G9K737_9ACTN|nr:protein kinase [Nonomuraea jiangxiensis]SDL45581.1 serine/threonine protein kinase [Nonomuraea jiangxiensis]
MVAQGTTLAGRYRLDTRIGAGGMGEVWRGEDIVLARTVAVKVLLPGRMEDPGFVARFQAEARAMATINHSGVVDVYDYGVSGDTVYLVMKFVDGEPLDRLLARLGRIPPQAAMELIAQAASALQAVHDRGIVHRDVKPGNLLVQRDGTLVLTDFGIARSDIASRLTDAGMVLGTAAYCAPEQAEGAPVTPAVDIYALGVVAYECLVGQRPFDGDSAVTIALKHIREAPPPLPVEIPQPVRTLVDIALSKDPARRYPTAKAMSEAARAIATGQELPAPQMMPTTGATMAPPPAAYQTGVQPARPAETTTAMADRRAGGRRGTKAPRRTGLIAGIAAVVVLGVGAGAVALTGMGAPVGSQDPDTGATTSKVTNVPSRPKTSKPVRPRTSEPTPTEREEQPTVKPPVRPSETEKEEEPTKTPSSTPTVTKTPTNSPSPTVKKVQVPKVVGMRFLVGQDKIAAAGLQPELVDQTNTSNGPSCGTIQETVPAGGKWVEKGETVKLVVTDGPCQSDPPPTDEPTPTVSPRQ